MKQNVSPDNFTHPLCCVDNTSCKLLAKNHLKLKGINTRDRQISYLPNFNTRCGTTHYNSNTFDLCRSYRKVSNNSKSIVQKIMNRQFDLEFDNGNNLSWSDFSFGHQVRPSVLLSLKNSLRTRKLSQN